MLKICQKIGKWTHKNACARCICLNLVELQANLVPTPKEWYHDSDDHDLLVPKSQPIVYAQIPFYLNNLGDTQEMVEMIKQVKAHLFCW